MEYELYHHGILGQRWGQRNGPPYPLSGSQHSAYEKKKGWQKSLKDPDSAKGYARRLNKYDKQRAKYEYNSYKVQRAANEYDERMRDALRKGKLDKAEKNMAKRDKELAKNKDHLEYNEKQIQAIKDETARLLKDASGKGYSLTSEATYRRVRDGEDHVLNALAIAGGAAIISTTHIPFIVVPAVGGRVAGTKYKAEKR